MKRYEDLTGKRFGYLLVLKPDIPLWDGRNFISTSYCICDCGTYKTVRNNSLKSGQTKSCGCMCEKNRQKILNHTKENSYDLTHEYGIGYINYSDKTFLFDKEDYDKIRNFSWTLSHNYILAHPYGSSNIYLHKFIMDVDNAIVDHINGNTLDCRKQNLRIASHAQNSMNRKVSVNNTSGITGVTWKKDKEKWKAYITVKGKQIHLGYFKKEELEKAILARKTAEKEYFKEFARK